MIGENETDYERWVDCVSWTKKAMSWGKREKRHTLNFFFLFSAVVLTCFFAAVVFIAAHLVWGSYSELTTKWRLQTLPFSNCRIKSSTDGLYLTASRNLLNFKRESSSYFCPVSEHIRFRWFHTSAEDLAPSVFLVILKLQSFTCDWMIYNACFGLTISGRLAVS